MLSGTSRRPARAPGPSGTAWCGTPPHAPTLPSPFPVYARRSWWTPSPSSRQRADPGIALRPDRGRLHRRLRHRPADQLRPRRDLHDRCVRSPLDLADLLRRQPGLLGPAVHDPRRDPRLRRPRSSWARRLAAAARATARPAHHGHRHLDLPAGRRLFYGSVPFADFPDASSGSPSRRSRSSPGRPSRSGTSRSSARRCSPSGHSSCAPPVSGTSSTSPRPAAGCRPSRRTPTPRASWASTSTASSWSPSRWCHPRGHRGRRPGTAGHEHQLQDGLPRRPQGVHRRGARRHRQRLGGRGRRAHPGHRRGDGRPVHPGHLRWQPVEGRVGLRPPHRPGLPTQGILGAKVVDRA